jgi:KDO2-lipid IV(A) lauroyltransferase
MSYIPFHIAQVMGKCLGLFAYLIPMDRKRVAFENIHESFREDLTEADARKLLRKVYMHFGQMLLEIPHIMRLKLQNINRYVTFQGEENLKQAMKKGKGVLCLTGHLGNWEFMSAGGALYYGDSIVVARHSEFAPLDRIINELRGHFGTEIVEAEGAMRQLLRALKNGGRIGILLDQNVDWFHGAFVPFFGRTACTNKGLALMALKTGAPVIPIFSSRDGDGIHRVVFGEEVELQKTGDKTRDVEDNTALFTRVIESYIRQNPDQWFWFHKRWKTKNYCEWPQK